jgi:glycosyltransferase involved in cell wall biosynthesis
MLSVLIPVYNWDIRKLATEIHAQCSNLHIDFEIIALDDASPNSQIKNANSQIHLEKFKFVQLEQNAGNAEARNILARSANFENLLFLDCDVLPVRNDFVKRYLEFSGEPKIVCGGILYENLKDKKYSLRWKFGKKHEEVSPMESQKNPYLNIRGCNFFIPKSLFLQHPFSTLYAGYGYVDTFFALSLEKAKIEAVHIDNPVFHLGLEENRIYVHKFEKSIQNAKWLIKTHPEMAEKLRLAQFYQKIKKWNLDLPVAWFYRIFKNQILNNLYSENPSLFLFQIYKLGYLCSMKDE